MADGNISPWFPEQDRVTLAVLGKLIEELNEMSARAARCIIQGCDEKDPDSGRTNLDELEREAADVMACLQMAKAKLGVFPSAARQGDKFQGFLQWHELIEAGEPAEVDA